MFQDLDCALAFAEPPPEDENELLSLPWAASHLALAGRHAEASALLERILAARGGYTEVQSAAGLAALVRSDYAVAAEHLERVYTVGGPVVLLVNSSAVLSLDLATLLACVRIKAGNADGALALLDETEAVYRGQIEGGATSSRARLGLAAVDALRGDTDAAYDWLQQAVDAGFFQRAELRRHPCFESLHGDPRFERLMDAVQARLEEQLQASSSRRPRLARRLSRSVRAATASRRRRGSGRRSIASGRRAFGPRGTSSPAAQHALVEAVRSIPGEFHL